MRILKQHCQNVPERRLKSKKISAGTQVRSDAFRHKILNLKMASIHTCLCPIHFTPEGATTNQFQKKFRGPRAGARKAKGQIIK